MTSTAEFSDARALDIAREVAGEAAELLRHAAGTARHIGTKSTPRDLVTEWDTRSEDLIRERLRALAPDIPMLGEERGASEGDAERGRDARHLWLVDPIDGTVNFSHGLPLFSVVIALERDGEAVVGVVNAPALGWEFYGRRGHGAYVSGREFGAGQKLAVSSIDTLERALLTTGFPYDRAHNPDNNFALWEHFQRRAGACRRFGSASLDLCMVACGWLDGYWERRLSPWDVAAGALLVREAGGRVSSYDGQPFVSKSGEIVASNGVLHERMLEQLAAVRSQ